VLGEHLEDHGLLLGELLGLAIPAAGPEGAEVDLIAAEGEHRGRRSVRNAVVPVAAPDDGAYPQQEFLQMKGLREVVIAAGFKPAYPVGRIPARGEEQHRGVVALLAQRPAHRKAVDPGQHDIQNDKGAARARKPGERLLAVSGGTHFVALGTQVLNDPGC